jgi:hypothetical protein
MDTLGLIFLLAAREGKRGQENAHVSTVGRYIMVRFPRNNELRPYTTKSTASRPICVVKQSMAESVLWWGTTWEYSVL